MKKKITKASLKLFFEKSGFDNEDVQELNCNSVNDIESTVIHILKYEASNTNLFFT